MLFLILFGRSPAGQATGICVPDQPQIISWRIVNRQIYQKISRNFVRFAVDIQGLNEYNK